MLDFTKLSPEQAVWLSGVVLFVITTLIEKLSGRFKPWSTMLRSLGRALNQDLKDQIDVIRELEASDQRADEARLDALEKAQNDFYELYKEDDAKAARGRILRFSDELRVKVRHSEEFFNNILEDIHVYESYCETHPNFLNRKAQSAIEFIEEIYEKCLRENDFL